MQVTETLADGLRREYKVVVPAADIKNEIEDRLVSLSKSVEIGGFRKGKVPVSLVRQRYAASVLRDVLKATVAESSERLMQ